MKQPTAPSDELRTESAAPAPAPAIGSATLPRVLWRLLVLPILVAIGLVFIAVGLIEGPPVGDFLYAIF